jgi:uncharacterized membrane protein YcaP (DUF421 family)
MPFIDCFIVVLDVGEIVVKQSLTIEHTMVAALIVLGTIVLSTIILNYACIELEAGSDGLRLKIERQCL